MPFKPGDPVQLISGGPCMTVNSEDIDPIGAMDENRNRNYVCTWFDKGKLCKGTFPEPTLKVWEAPRMVSLGTRGGARRR